MKEEPKHHHRGRFRNNAETANTHMKVSNLVNWKLHAPKVKPKTFSSVPVDDLGRRGEGVSWIGHATFLIQLGGHYILTDPVFSDRASPSQLVGPKRTTPPACTIEQLPKIDFVVISHDHYDHLDKQSILELDKRFSPRYIVPLKCGAWFSKLGINRWVECDWWGSVGFEDVSFHCVPTQHFSGRGVVPNPTLWAGWVIESKHSKHSTDSYKIFFAGDTGYSADFKDIGNKHGPIDLSLIPIGAYEPRWFMKEVHVNPEEAVQIHLDVKSKRSIGMHWGSFILTDEPMDEPPKHLRKALDKLGVDPNNFTTLLHGEHHPLQVDAKAE